MARCLLYPIEWPLPCFDINKFVYACLCVFRTFHSGSMTVGTYGHFLAALSLSHGNYVPLDTE